MCVTGNLWLVIWTCKHYRTNSKYTLFFALGTYFSSGSSKRKLDYFLIFLQAYYWFKKSLWKEAFPPLLEHVFKDTLTTLRPKLKLCQNYEEALEELNNIRKALGIGKKEICSQLKKLFKNKEKLFSEKLLEFDKAAEEDGLETINETDNEEGVEDEASEGIAAPITDDTATEDETVDNTQGSDEEGKI